jgi:PST family polysaccharide transporter
LALIGAIILASLDYGVTALVVQQLIIAVVTATVLVAFSRWLPGLPKRNHSVMSLINYSYPTLAAQILNYFSVNIAQIAIGRTLGATAVGLYSRAYQLFTLPLQQVASPMTRVALPRLARAWRDGSFEETLNRMQLLLNYLLITALLFIVAVAHSLTAILLGDGWESTASTLQILAIGGIFQVLGYTYYWAFLASGKTALILRYETPARVLMIVGCGGPAWNTICGGCIRCRIGNRLAQLHGPGPSQAGAKQACDSH